MVDTLVRPRVSSPGTDNPGMWQVVRDGRVSAIVSIPDYPWERTVLAPDLSLWSTTGDDPVYRVHRWTLEPLDTTLVIEVARPLQPVDMREADSIATGL